MASKDRKIVNNKYTKPKEPECESFIKVEDALVQFGQLAPVRVGANRQSYAWTSGNAKTVENTFRSFVSRHLKEGDDKIVDRYANGYTKSVRVRWCSAKNWWKGYSNRPGDMTVGKKSHGEAWLTEEQREAMKEMKVDLGLRVKVTTSIIRSETVVIHNDNEHRINPEEKKREFAIRVGFSSWSRLIRSIADGKTSVKVFHSEDTPPPQKN